MASREGLLRIAARGAALATTRRARFVGQILLVAGLVFAIVRFRSMWGDSGVSFGDISWSFLAAAVVVTAVAVATSAFIWIAILERLGVKTHLRWVGIFFQAQLSKYIPGAVWQYAGRTTLAQARGLPVRPVAISLSVELVASAVAAAVVSAFLLGAWGAAVVVAVVVAALWAERRLARPRGPMRAWVTACAIAVPLYAVALTVLGVGFWLTARAFGTASAGDVAIFVGAFSAAWVVGLLAIYAPGGIGVREAVLVAILHNRIGTADALVVAAASRAVGAGVDVLAAGVALLLLRRAPAPVPVGAAEREGSGGL